MRKPSKLIKIALMGAIVGVSGQSCDLSIWDILPGGEQAEMIEDAYGYDAGQPPKVDSQYAVKIYAWSGNCLDDPNDILGAPDKKYVRFRCTPENPLEIVVGFGKEFSQVWVTNFHNKMLAVEGGAASPMILSGMDDNVKYVWDKVRRESGQASPNPRCEFCKGGEVQVDTKYGSERIFKFSARPYSGEDVIEIDGFTIK